MTDTERLQAAFDDTGSDVIDLTGSEWAGGLTITDTITRSLPKLIVSNPGVVINYTQGDSAPVKPAISLVSDGDWTGGAIINHARGAATAWVEGIVRADGAAVLEDLAITSDYDWTTVGQTVRPCGIHGVSPSLIVRRATISSVAGYGIFSENQGTTEIFDSTITKYGDNGIAVYCGADNGATLIGNTVDQSALSDNDPRSAVFLAGDPTLLSGPIFIDKNHVLGSPGAIQSSNGAITLRDCSNYEVTRNRVTDGAIGISIDNGYNGLDVTRGGIVADNIIRGQTYYGIEIAGNRARVYGNSIDGQNAMLKGIAVQGVTDTGATRALNDIDIFRNELKGFTPTQFYRGGFLVSNYDYWKSDGTSPRITRGHSAAPRCRVYLSASQSANTGGLTFVHFDHVTEDNAGGWSASDFSYASPEAGVYLVVAAFSINNSGTPPDAPQMGVYVNGVAAKLGTYPSLVGLRTGTLSMVAGLVRTAAGDKISGRGFTPSCVAAIFGGAQLTYMDIVKVSE